MMRHTIARLIRRTPRAVRYFICEFTHHKPVTPTSRSVFTYCTRCYSALPTPSPPAPHINTHLPRDRRYRHRR